MTYNATRLYHLLRVFDAAGNFFRFGWKAIDQLRGGGPPMPPKGCTCVRVLEWPLQRSDCIRLARWLTVYESGGALNNSGKKQSADLVRALSELGLPEKMPVRPRYRAPPMVTVKVATPRPLKVKVENPPKPKKPKPEPKPLKTNFVSRPPVFRTDSSDIRIPVNPPTGDWQKNTDAFVRPVPVRTWIAPALLELYPELTEETWKQMLSESKIRRKRARFVDIE